MSLTIPPYEGQGWTNGSTPDLSAETLNAVDAGITANSEAINAIANAVTNQIINDPDKIASIAVAYALQQQINEVNSNLTDVVGALDYRPIYAKNSKILTGVSEVAINENGYGWIPFGEAFPTANSFVLSTTATPLVANIAYVSSVSENGFTIMAYDISQAPLVNINIWVRWFAICPTG